VDALELGGIVGLAGGMVFDFGDDVAGEDALAEGGGAGNGLFDLEEFVEGIEADLDAQAAELALGVALELLEALFGDVVAVVVELAEDAVVGADEQFVGIDLIDVSHLDLADGEAEGLEESAAPLRPVVLGLGQDGTEQQSHGHPQDESYEQTLFAQHICVFRMSG
jgi:hypothetical protein